MNDSEEEIVNETMTAKRFYLHLYSIAFSTVLLSPSLNGLCVNALYKWKYNRIECMHRLQLN